MANTTMLDEIKNMLRISSSDTSRDTEINGYIDFAKQAILNHLYVLSSVPSNVDFPSKYNSVAVMSVITGIDTQGSENHKTHNENGVNITMHYTDMLQYIRNNVIPYAKVGG